MTITPVKSPCKYVGGKSESAERIVSLFPSSNTYDTYIDACGGAAHVLVAKPRYDHKEVYNDLDNNLCTFWLEVQHNAEALTERLQSLPYSRFVYYQYYRSLFDGTELSSFERAVRYFYVLRSTGTGWVRKSHVGWNNTNGNVQAYRSITETFEAIQQRFQRVLIDNRDVLDTIDRYDSPQAFFYIDPPYFGAEIYYETSKKGFNHEGLAKKLQGVQGKVAVSYYPHPSIDSFYPADKWHRVTWTQAKSSQVQHRDRVDLATEMLLTNYPASQASLWY